MKALLLLLESLICLALSSVGSSYPAQSQYPQHPLPSAYEGTPCEVPNGYLPYTCETGTLIESMSEILPADIHGPNVCRMTDLYLAREEEYVFQKQCAWEYDHYQHAYFYLCYLDCLPSGKCVNSTRNHTIENVHCCEGFATSPILKPSPISQLLSQFVVPANGVPSGCPIARANTLLQCLEIHGHFVFIEAVMVANLTYLFNSTTEKVTVFAPPDASLDSMYLDTLSEEEVVQFVLSHIVQGEVHAQDITFDGKLTSLYGNEIFTSTVEHYYYRPLVYQAPSKGYYYYYGSYSHHQGDYILLETERYVSGAMIEVADACALPSESSTPVGVLHLVDQPLPHTNLTVADQLQQNEEFSFFVELLEIFDIVQYLHKFSPYTIFAPVNDSFEIYEGAWDCLSRFERNSLNDLLLYHILDSAEYSSTLKARDIVYTKLLQPLTVEADDEQIFLMGADVAVPISEPDIPASNGVVHEIPSLLIPQSFDLGVCADHVTMPPSIEPSPSSTVVTLPQATSSLVRMAPSVQSSSQPTSSALPSPPLVSLPPGTTPSPNLTGLNFMEGFGPS